MFFFKEEDRPKSRVPYLSEKFLDDFAKERLNRGEGPGDRSQGELLLETYRRLDLLQQQSPALYAWVINSVDVHIRKFGTPAAMALTNVIFGVIDVVEMAMDEGRNEVVQ